MRSIVWHLGDGKPVEPGRLYWIRGDRWAEPSPMHCPAGHRLGPGRVLVGKVACAAVGGSHRTHACRTCNAVVMWPPATDHCDHRVFDERRAP
ncbi:hypothetical protein AB0J48_20385 [Nocardia salmonicida]|uniref:hypothetical protein n=1 Tax=Nocardia salmonicida TaxID=53431 RepID=UPI00342909F6